MAGLSEPMAARLLPGSYFICEPAPVWCTLNGWMFSLNVLPCVELVEHAAPFDKLTLWFTDCAFALFSLRDRQHAAPLGRVAVGVNQSSASQHRCRSGSAALPELGQLMASSGKGSLKMSNARTV